jgi:hypothetical protein
LRNEFFTGSFLVCKNWKRKEIRPAPSPQFSSLRKERIIPERTLFPSLREWNFGVSEHTEIG